MHTHLGEEKVVILQGSCRDEDGTVLKAGDYMTKATGTAHSFTVLDGPTLIYLSVIEEGIQIGDQVIKYDSPNF